MTGLVVASIIIAISLVVVVVVIGIRAVARGRALQNAAWLSVASAMGLSFEPETFTGRARMSGTVDGIGVEVQSVVESTGKNSTRYTRYRVWYPPVGIGFEARATGAWQKLLEWFGAQDVATGDEEFDPAVTAKGDDEAAVRAFLTPARRLSIHRLISEFGGVVIADASITWRAAGLESDGQRLMTVLRRLVGVAERMTESASGTNDAIRARAEGSPAGAVEMMTLGAGGIEDDMDLAESAYASGRYVEAAEALAALEDALPADVLVAAWRRRAEERQAIASLPAPSEALLPDPAEIAADLFAPSLLSYEAARRFEDRYEGRTARWKGEVIRSAPYRSDLDLGPGPGVRSVVRIHRLGWDLYGGRDVDAIVALPEGAIVEVGSEITFEGRLVRADSLMRNLFVAEGRLVD